MFKKIKSKFKTIPFHMPGHKRNKKFFNTLGNNLLDYDFTEINDLDNLHCANGIIDTAQKKCANIFGCERSFFLVNGASCGVLSSICATCCEQDYILALRSSHISFYNALEISGAKAVFIYQKKFNGIFYDFNFNKFEDFLNKNKKIKAVFITSPNYYGVCLDLTKIAKMTRKYNKILIVDESHGSHFYFNNFFPDSAIKCGANIVINSLHKTLPCLTQSAVLNINNLSKFYVGRLEKYLKIFQTSSPSYILMSIIDFSIRKIDNNKNLFERYIKEILKIRKKLNPNKNIKLLEKESYNLIYDIDISKLTFINYSNYKSKDFIDFFRDNNIELELISDENFIAITSVCDRKKNLDKLLNAINKLEKISNKENKNNCVRDNVFLKDKSVMSIKSANKQKNKKVLLKDSINKICAQYIIKYPPGIPILIPGEIISHNHINMIQEHYSEIKILV
ncbi:MAG: aminotransferase class I/II-fold pyridoxal phosphate-dependent enzyme [Clostridiales bacterium]|jgi:lysine decarboxylase|nr:aminotransferase class I/II-fold pyridoxal phosphate-dependent enzyme [Clostridiales bacterium]